MHSRRCPRPAFTLVELLVSLGVLSVLVSVLLPAIMQTRESARRVSCQNNCRQFALATLGFESTWKEYPSTYFSELPVGQKYEGDQGALVALLPHLGETIGGDQFLRSELMVQDVGSRRLTDMPSVFSCPSSIASSELKGLSTWCSGNSVADLSTTVPSYVFSSGVYPLVNDSLRLSTGVAGVDIPGVSKSKRAAEVTDGLSNSLCSWETRSDSLVSSSGLLFDFDQAAPSGADLFASETVKIEFRGAPTTKVWLYSWIGNGAGTLFLFDRGTQKDWNASCGGEVVNVTNLVMGPMSMHSGGVYVSRLDGSVHFISNNVSSDVIGRLARIADGGQ